MSVYVSVTCIHRSVTGPLLGGPWRAKDHCHWFLYAHSEDTDQTGQIRTSRKFGQIFANSGNPDETAPYEPSHQDFHGLLC